MGKRGPLVDNVPLRDLKQRLLDDEADAREEQIRRLKAEDEDAACAQREIEQALAGSHLEMLRRMMSAIGLTNTSVAGVARAPALRTLGIEAI